MHEGEGEVAELVVPGVDAEEFDDGLEGFVADFHVLTCGYFGVFEEVAWRTVEDYHSCVVEHV